MILSAGWRSSCGYMKSLGNDVAQVDVRNWELVHCSATKSKCFRAISCLSAEPNSLRRHKSVEHRRKSLSSGRGSLGSGRPSSLQHAITEPTATIQVQAAAGDFPLAVISSQCVGLARNASNDHCAVMLYRRCDIDHSCPVACSAQKHAS